MQSLFRKHYDPGVCQCLSLEARNQWVLWKRTDGHKKPYQIADPELPASLHSPWEWGSALWAGRQMELGQADGAGFVFTADDPFVGLDLDDCIDETGEVHPAAADLVALLDGYTEVTPSGRGLHVIVEGVWNGDRNRCSMPWGGRLEVYDHARFFTMTCRGSGQIREAQLELNRLATTVLASKRRQPGAKHPRGGSSDAGVIARAKAARNGAKFARLWGGSTEGYGSWSEADLALCEFLAYWKNQDAEAVDRLFRLSGLMRDKWDREDYREATIKAALEFSESNETGSSKHSVWGIEGEGVYPRFIKSHTKAEVRELKKRHQAGEIEPWPVTLGPLPDEATDADRKVYADLKLVIGLRYRDGALGAPALYACGPAAEDLGLSKATVSRSLKKLRAWGVVRPGQTLAPKDGRQRGTNTFLPLAAAPQIPRLDLDGGPVQVEVGRAASAEHLRVAEIEA